MRVEPSDPLFHVIDAEAEVVAKRIWGVITEQEPSFASMLGALMACGQVVAALITSLDDSFPPKKGDSFKRTFDTELEAQLQAVPPSSR
jgi:hypothetical protein